MTRESLNPIFDIKIMMRLIGGPWNGRIIHDIGTVNQKMVIYSEFDEDRKPIPGCKTGYAIYEPNEDRMHSFWLTNVWDAHLEKTCSIDDQFNFGE